MSKDDEAERKAFGGIIPARPKGAPSPTPPPLDDLLKRRQTMFGDMPEDHPARARVAAADAEELTPEETSLLDAFFDIMKVLRRLPKSKHKRVIGAIADLLD